jgi:hypothetical protein
MAQATTGDQGPLVFVAYAVHGLEGGREFISLTKYPNRATPDYIENLNLSCRRHPPWLQMSTPPILMQAASVLKLNYFCFKGFRGVMKPP